MKSSNLDIQLKKLVLSLWLASIASTSVNAGEMPSISNVSTAYSAVESGKCASSLSKLSSSRIAGCDPDAIEFISNISCNAVRPTVAVDTRLTYETMDADTQDEFYGRLTQIEKAHERDLARYNSSKAICERYGEFALEEDRVHQYRALAARLGSVNLLKNYALHAKLAYGQWPDEAAPGKVSNDKRNPSERAAFQALKSKLDKFEHDVIGVLTDYAERDPVSAYAQLAEFEISRQPILWLESPELFDGPKAEFERRRSLVESYLGKASKALGNSKSEEGSENIALLTELVRQ